MLAKIKLSSLKVLISKALIVSYIIGHDEFVLVKTVKGIKWYERKNSKILMIDEYFSNVKININHRKKTCQN